MEPKMKKISIGEKIEVSVPETLMFVSEIFLPSDCKLPSYVEKMMSTYGRTLTLNTKIKWIGWFKKRIYLRIFGRFSFTPLNNINYILVLIIF